MRIQFFNDSENLVSISSSMISFSDKCACDLEPSGEPGLKISSFVAVLIPGQIFWKDAKIVDRRFPVMSPRKEFAFRGFIFAFLSHRFLRFNINFEGFRTRGGNNV